MARKTATARIRTNTTASPDSRMANMPEEYLFCRTEGHGRKWLGDEDVIVNTRGFIVRFTSHIQCPNCGLEKWATYELPSLDRIHLRVQYPDGYVAVGGRLDRHDVRFEQLSRRGYKLKKA